MSTLRTTTASNLTSLGATSNTGDTYFETTNKRIVVWDGTNWVVYDYDTVRPNYTTNALAVSYDGTDDYHAVSLNGTSTGGILASSDSDVELTLSFWIYPETTTPPIYLSWGNTPTAPAPYWTIQHNRIFVDNGFRNFSTNLTQNAWNHVLVTRTASNNNWNVFLNGNSSAVTTYNDSGSQANRSNATNFYTGIGYNSSTTCKIDELAFWNSDQSSNLSTIYGSSTAGSGSPANLESLNPYGWWRMGDGISGATNGGAAGTISSFRGSANDLTVGGGNPTYTNSVA